MESKKYSGAGMYQHHYHNDRCRGMGDSRVTRTLTTELLHNIYQLLLDRERT